MQNISKWKKQTNMGFLMLKDHKSAIHLEGLTFDKVVRNSIGTEQFLNFLLFNSCHLEIMRFIHSFDNMFLFSNNNVTHMNVSKQYKENRSVRIFLTTRKHKINLLLSSNFLPKIVPFTCTVLFTYFIGFSESILCYKLIYEHTVNLGSHGGSVVELRTLEREVKGSNPTTAV